MKALNTVLASAIVAVAFAAALAGGTPSRAQQATCPNGRPAYFGECPTERTQRPVDAAFASVRGVYCDNLTNPVLLMEIEGTAARFKVRENYYIGRWGLSEYTAVNATFNEEDRSISFRDTMGRGSVRLSPLGDPGAPALGIDFRSGCVNGEYCYRTRVRRCDVNFAHPPTPNLK